MIRTAHAIRNAVQAFSGIKGLAALLTVGISCALLPHLMQAHANIASLSAFAAPESSRLPASDFLISSFVMRFGAWAAYLAVIAWAVSLCICIRAFLEEFWPGLTPFGLAAAYAVFGILCVASQTSGAVPGNMGLYLLLAGGLAIEGTVLRGGFGTISILKLVIVCTLAATFGVNAFGYALFLVMGLVMTAALQPSFNHRAASMALHMFSVVALSLCIAGFSIIPDMDVRPDFVASNFMHYFFASSHLDAVFRGSELFIMAIALCSIYPSAITPDRNRKRLTFAALIVALLGAGQGHMTLGLLLLSPLLAATLTAGPLGELLSRRFTRVPAVAAYTILAVAFICICAGRASAKPEPYTPMRYMHVVTIGTQDDADRMRLTQARAVTFRDVRPLLAAVQPASGISVYFNHVAYSPAILPAFIRFAGGTYDAIAPPEFAAKYVGGNDVIVGQADPLSSVIPANPRFLRFPNRATVWTAINATVLYVSTGSQPLAIQGIQNQDGAALIPIGVVTRERAQGFGIRGIGYPIVLAAHTNAIVQVNGYHGAALNVQTASGTSYSVAVQTGSSAGDVNFAGIAGGDSTRIALRPQDRGLYRLIARNPSASSMSVIFQGETLQANRSPDGSFDFGEQRLTSNSYSFALAPAQPAARTTLALVRVDQLRPARPSFRVEHVEPGRVIGRINDPAGGIAVLNDPFSDDWILLTGSAPWLSVLFPVKQTAPHLVTADGTNAWYVASASYGEELTAADWRQGAAYAAGILAPLALLVSLLLGALTVRIAANPNQHQPDAG